MTSKARLLAELMSEAQGGNKSSYETLLAEVAMFLDSYLRSKVSDSSQRDDIVQESLLAIHKARHTFNPNLSFMSWMLAIAHHKLADHLRIKMKYSFVEVNDGIQDSTESTIEKLIEFEKNAALEHALQELDSRSKEIVCLVKIEGLKISEVAKKLGLTESNTKVIAHRAYQTLENKLKGLYEN